MTKEENINIKIQNGEKLTLTEALSVLRRYHFDWRCRQALDVVLDAVDPWHYPSKGEYPTENGEYWVAWRSLRTGQLMYGVGLWELDRFWLNPQPKAWQYIVPPKE